MIEQDALTHWLTVNRMEALGTRDQYTGQMEKRGTPIRMACFYDAKERRIKKGGAGDYIDIAGMIFLHPDTKVTLLDEVLKIEDAYGNVLAEEGQLKIMSVKPLNDDDGLHHYEVLLQKYAVG